ncbi:hypothetical protein KKH42_03240, partial [bacterium]|nr:hypothetical protein [bacterium]
IADKEKTLLEKKEALKKKTEKLLKAAVAEGEQMMAAAESRSAEDKEKILSERKKQADAEVRELILNSEIESKKAAVIFRNKSKEIVMTLFKELDGYLKN